MMCFYNLRQTRIPVGSGIMVNAESSSLLPYQRVEAIPIAVENAEPSSTSDSQWSSEYNRDHAVTPARVYSPTVHHVLLMRDERTELKLNATTA